MAIIITFLVFSNGTPRPIRHFLKDNFTLLAAAPKIHAQLQTIIQNEINLSA